MPTLAKPRKQRDLERPAEPRGVRRHGKKLPRRTPDSDPLPDAIEPELATLVDEAPSGDQWVHEIKLDGYRIMARVEQGQVTLFTRNGKDWTERMPTLRAALARLELLTAMFDGELVALNERGVSDFQALQNSLHDGGDAGLVYFAFDLLHLDGRDLRARPLVERKSLLRELLERHSGDLNDRIRFSAHLVGNGPDFFESASKLGLEGTIAKRVDSPYRSGRGRDWLKIKGAKRQEFAIVGYTEPGGSRQHFGALLLAVSERGRLRYTGRVGTGFSAASLEELWHKLQPLTTSEPALENPPSGADARGVKWVRPELVAHVGFSELTSDGLLRHPRFYGLREDKQVAEAKLETPAPAPEQPAATSNGGYPLSNPGKVLYPLQGISKREVLDYYAMVTGRMLPHVANRPLTLLRCPDGIGKPGFFQKHPAAGMPPGLRSIPIRERDGKAPYSVLDDQLGLFGLVQLGALEVHTWGSRADDFEHPDTLVFDLDPDPALDYSEVIRCAQTLRQLFEQAKLETFVKTTGGKGLHVCLPITPDLDWNEAKDFSARIAEAMAQNAPHLYVATASKAKRRGKIYIDYLRNGRGATFIAPYSTRARDNAPVAVPLEWDELSVSLPPDHFTLRNLGARLAKLRTDPFARLAQLKQRLRPEAMAASSPQPTTSRKA